MDGFHIQIFFFTDNSCIKIYGFHFCLIKMSDIFKFQILNLLVNIFPEIMMNIQFLQS